MAKTYTFLVFCLLALALVRFVQGACTNSTYHILGMKELKEKDIQKLLDSHNKFREITAKGKAPAPNYENQPSAANMLELTWDEEAAKLAYKMASTCEWKHDYVIGKDGKKMGQNIGMKGSTRKSDVDKTFYQWAHSIVRNWFLEAKDYNYRGSNNKMIGHYTQLAWAETMQVGCGYSYFWYIDEKKKKWYIAHLVCNYKPGGNMNNENPYIEGEVNCESYGLQPPSEKYPHLCKKK